MAINDDFDQYYTKQPIAINCCKIIYDLFPNINWKEKIFIEPSAGTGSFINAAKDIFGTIKIKAYDIDPKATNIVKADFLTRTIRGKNVITIGNPPFGKRSSLAIKFFNKSAINSNIIAFIVPVQFEKYGVQNKLDPRFKLIYSEKLDKNSFIHDDKDCDIRCVFQIWTTLDTDYPDKRILCAPATTHPDFEMFLYNNTKGALKFFDKNTYGWNFAVPRQGYYDYSLRIENQADLKENIQYMFFKSENTDVINRLKSINYEELSHNNTTIPGYGKADVVKRYEEVLNNE